MRIPLKLLILLYFLSIPTFSQSQSEAPKENTDKPMTYQETLNRLYIIRNNFEAYYNKYHYPIAFPEVKNFISRYEFPYKKIVDRHFNPPVPFESCLGQFQSSYMAKPSAEERESTRRYQEMSNADCNRRNQVLALNKSEEIQQDAIQKEWRRSNCKNPDILALIDFYNFLQKNDKIYKSCLELQEPIDEVNFIRSIKIKIFDLIREPVIEFPKEFKNLTEEENRYVSAIYKISLELLTEYGNFESYYESLPVIENPAYIKHDIIFEVIYPRERYNKIIYLYNDIKNHKYSLLLDELHRGSERGNELNKDNKKLLTEIKLANTRILNNKYISMNNKKQFNQLLLCLDNFSEKHLERISLAYYSGLFKKYGTSEYTPTNKEGISKDFFEIINLFNNNFYNSKLLELRLINRLQNCDMVRQLPYEEVSFKKIIKNSCVLNERYGNDCESYEK